ncbi:MAG: hypothetical protein ABI948_03125 [Thermoleophilia bacterium]
MKSRILFLAALAAFALIPAAHATVRAQGVAQPRTTEPPPLVDIHVKITDTRIVLDRLTAARGDYARFIVRNAGTKTHGFSLGKSKPGTGLQTGFTRTLKPNVQKILLLFLDYRGALPFSSQLPADRSKPGMRGIFTIN